MRAFELCFFHLSLRTMVMVKCLPCCRKLKWKKYRPRRYAGFISQGEALLDVLARTSSPYNSSFFYAGAAGPIPLPLENALLDHAQSRCAFSHSQVGAVYVNRGLGMEGGSAPRLRFWSRPEITVFHVHPAREAGRPKN